MSNSGYEVIRTANFRRSGLATIQPSNRLLRCLPAATTAASSSALRSRGMVSESKIVIGISDIIADRMIHGRPSVFMGHASGMACLKKPCQGRWTWTAEAGKCSAQDAKGGGGTTFHFIAFSQTHDPAYLHASLAYRYLARSGWINFESYSRNSGFRDRDEVWEFINT
jgi:hypothetical protein